MRVDRSLLLADGSLLLANRSLLSVDGSLLCVNIGGGRGRGRKQDTEGVRTGLFYALIGLF